MVTTVMLKSSILISVAVHLVSLDVQITHGAKILAVINYPSPSHNIFNRVLTSALAARGHQVVVISPDVEKHPPANLTYIKLDGSYKAMQEAVCIEEHAGMSAWSTLPVMNHIANVICENQLKAEGTKKLMNCTEHFDLIIAEQDILDCLLGFNSHFGFPPVIGISSGGVRPWTANFMGTPEVPSYIPNYLLPYTSEMNFFQRIHTFVFHIVLKICYGFIHIPKLEVIAKRSFNSSFSYWDIERNFSLFLANTVPGLDSARPLSPNIIPIGGMHIKEKTDPLPKDVKEFLDDAKEGFIYFSLGTNLKSSGIPVNKQQALLEAFSELPLRVLWKFESDNLSEQPPNLKIGKWFPQNSVLAHPNVRVFISHCGKLGTIESIYHGVPIVGMPFVIDQFLIIESLKRNGVAVELDYSTLTKESVLKAVREVLYNQSYAENMKKMSAILMDQPDTPLERAIFWVEYVLRRGGMSHIRPISVDMHWHEYLLFDALLVSGAATLLVTKLFLVLRKLYKTSFEKNKHRAQHTDS